VNRPDKLAREAIARQLPRDFLKPRPIEALWCVPLFLLAALGTFLILGCHLPWFLNLLVAVLLGNTYASFFFLGHYIVHGANTQSKFLQRLLGFLCFAPLGMSPHLWKVWHHTMHHPLTNYPGKDPDNFGDIQHQRKNPIPHLFIPGNRRVLPSLLFLMFFFTGHVLSVLFIYSKGKLFSRLNKKKAYRETAAIALLAVLFALLSGRLALFTILVPWVVANVIGVSYTVTQHLLLPLTRSMASLDTSMSVRVPRWIDAFHFYNSHHVEHHLFPEASMKALRQIRSVLTTTAHFKCPPMSRALYGVWLTPRFHEGEYLIDHKTAERVSFFAINRFLAGEKLQRNKSARVFLNDEGPPYRYEDLNS
jgi:fatty acid desaturase